MFYFDGKRKRRDKYTELETEKDHSKFLECLLAALYGEGWEKVTIYDAKEWHKKHFNK